MHVDVCLGWMCLIWLNGEKKNVIDIYYNFYKTINVGIVRFFVEGRVNS